MPLGECVTFQVSTGGAGGARAGAGGAGCCGCDSGVG